MAYFVWDSALETGYEALDSQHKRLFDLANGIELAVEQHPGDNEAAIDAVYGLIDYVVEHFQNEEAIMAEYQYPDAGQHKALHVQLGVETMAMAARCMSGETLTPLELAPFVRNWLYDHIRVHDMRLVAFIRRTTLQSVSRSLSEPQLSIKRLPRRILLRHIRRLRERGGAACPP